MQMFKVIIYETIKIIGLSCGLIMVIGGIIAVGWMIKEMIREWKQN